MSAGTSATVHFQGTDAFKSQALAAGTVSVVDFWAEWCGPCKAIGPTIDEIATEYQGKAIVGKVDVDANKDLAVEYQVASIPTILFFKDGQLVDRLVGLNSKDQITERIDKLLV